MELDYENRLQILENEKNKQIRQLSEQLKQEKDNVEFCKVKIKQLKFQLSNITKTPKISDQSEFKVVKINNFESVLGMSFLNQPIN